MKARQLMIGSIIFNPYQFSRVYAVAPVSHAHGRVYQISSIGHPSTARRHIFSVGAKHHSEGGAAHWEAKNDSWQFFATCHPGLEGVVAQELLNPSVAATRVEVGRAGVSFWGPDLATGYRANLWLRAAIRVLVLLAEGDLNPRQRGGDELYRFARESCDWPAVLQPGQTFRVDARVRSCTDVPTTLLAHTRIRDAICDAMRDAGHQRPSPPQEGAAVDLPLFAALYRDHVQLYRDMSGMSLHRRGYRGAMHRSPLNEAAAAGALLLADWPSLASQGGDLVDPMCGSGTFLIEAALMAKRVAPGLMRPSWPFLTWPDHDRQAWEASVSAARSLQRDWPSPQPLVGIDIHPAAIALARRDSKAAGVAEVLDLRCGDCSAVRLQEAPQLVMVNPPWGSRLPRGAPAPSSPPMARASRSDGIRKNRSRNSSQESTDRDPSLAMRRPSSHDSLQREEQSLEETWSKLSRFLKAECPGANVFVLCGNSEATRMLRMKRDRMYPINIGGVDTRLVKYSVFDAQQNNGGSKPM
eukprot:jgi/Botrbrau1/21580/Bobra.174_2s0075.1